jgi:hypothetical protein
LAGERDKRDRLPLKFYEGMERSVQDCSRIPEERNTSYKTFFSK